MAFLARCLGCDRSSMPRSRKYLLLSHALGQGTETGHIANRVRLERSVSSVLGLGSVSPLHLKTLKKLISARSLDGGTFFLLSSLLENAFAWSALGGLVLVVDVVHDVSFQQWGELRALLRQLKVSGVSVLVVEPLRLGAVKEQGLASTCQLNVKNFVLEP